MKVSSRVFESQTQAVESKLGWSQFTKGHNSLKTVNRVKNVDGVMVLFCYALSDYALYLYQVLSGYLIGFQSYGSVQ